MYSTAEVCGTPGIRQLCIIGHRRAQGTCAPRFNQCPPHLSTLNRTLRHMLYHISIGSASLCEKGVSLMLPSYIGILINDKLYRRLSSGDTRYEAVHFYVEAGMQ